MITIYNNMITIYNKYIENQVQQHFIKLMGNKKRDCLH